MISETQSCYRACANKPTAGLLLSLLIAVVGMDTTSELFAQALSPFEVAPRAPQGPVTLTDVQLKETARGQFALRVQADGPLAFDRLAPTNARQILVRFHNTKPAPNLAWDSPQFGALSWSTIQGGSLTLTLDLMNPSTHTSVTQAGNPNSIEILIRQ